MIKIIEENLAKLNIHIDNKISKKLPVFYNPIMKLNRDISVYLLKSVSNLYGIKDLRIALPLAGSGVRGIRLLKELNKDIVREIHINDLSTEAFLSIQENIKLNNFDKDKRIFLYNKDANIFFNESFGFNYIDIDPFGSPNQFLDSAVNRLSRNSILAVTATDTAPLCGTFPNTCKRKYWANPLYNELMHEIGLRILIRKVQLIAGQYEKALTPILSYFTDHYMRIFFKCDKGKKKVDEIIKQHSSFYYNNFTIYLERELEKLSLSWNKSINCKYGPIWTGKLFDKKLIGEINKNIKNNENCSKFLNLLNEEEDLIGFFDIHKIAEKKKLVIPKMEFIIDQLKKNGFKASRTHFSQYGIKTDADIKELIKIMEN
jgi:tRNA (guanine26-N2/guanine27-N2)-dimethyltransferase